MLQSNRLQLKSKAALGLFLTIFVAAACSHKGDIKEDAMPEPVASETEVEPAPVFATEPDSVFEDSKTESLPSAPVTTSKKQRVSKHKSSKSSHKKHKISKRHKKNKKIAKNKRNLRKQESQMGSAAGIVNQLPPPPAPPAPPTIDQLPTPPPMFADNSQLQSPSNDGAGFQWLYVGTFLAIALGAVAYRYRGRFASKKSRRLIFN